jgi:hypothetical protein
MNDEGEERARIPRDASLEELLQAGQAAFDSGDRAGAHEFWRAAAVANPYDERVWLAMLKLLTSDDDREVCLENIIAINPLNPDARRELRTIRRKRRLTEEVATKEVAQAATVTPPAKKSPGGLPRALLILFAIGLVVIVLVVVMSLVYGGVLTRVVP